MTRRIVSRQDPRLAARITSRVPLVYSSGADPATDRPGHVRAGSSLASFAGRLAVLQDDANFVALVDVPGGTTDAIPLPALKGGRRQFPKRAKLDLEACVAAGEMLVAFGSGSTPRRERVAILRVGADGRFEASLVEAPELYAGLRSVVEFSGSELNIEGAVMLPEGRLRLFQRGNGAPRRGLWPVNATADLSWDECWDYLNGRTRPPPAPANVAQYDLGSVGSVPFSFTDATPGPRGILYAAVAEASADVVADGPVRGAALGVTDGNAGRWTFLKDESGVLFLGKVEGVSLLADDPLRGALVVDCDDPAVPSVLCRFELSGPWW